MKIKDKKPDIRFKEYNNVWEQCKLGDEAIEIIAGGDIDKEKVVEEGKYPIYANALTNDGIVGYYNDYFRVKAPAVTVTGRGEVGHAQARMTDFTPVVRLLTIQSNHDCYFLENAINNHKVVVESTGVPQLTVPQLASYNIFFPSKIEEEVKIGEYFNNIDNLITLHQRKVQKLEKIKKSMLVKMFPKQGEKEPEIRFSGFTDAWEQRKLRDLIRKPVTDGPHETPQLQDEGIPFLSVEAIHDGIIDISKCRGYISQEDDEKYKKKYVPEIGDVFFTKAATIGRVAVVRELGFNIWSPIGAIKPNNNLLSSDYLFYVLQTDLIQKKAIIAANNGTQHNLAMDAIEDFDIHVPREMQEQQCISDFLLNLDNLIALYQRKLEKLKIIKKCMMEKMFVV